MAVTFLYVQNSLKQSNFDENFVNEFFGLFDSRILTFPYLLIGRLERLPRQMLSIGLQGYPRQEVGKSCAEYCGRSLATSWTKWVTSVHWLIPLWLISSLISVASRFVGLERKCWMFLSHAFAVRFCVAAQTMGFETASVSLMNNFVTWHLAIIEHPFERNWNQASSLEPSIFKCCERLCPCSSHG